VSILPIYFIGQCLALDEHPSFREKIIAQFSDPGYDWNSFIWTGSNHLVLPAIYLKLRKHDLLGYLPEVLAHHLEEIHSLNHARNEQILLQVRAINGTLNAAGISPIYLKGTGNLIDGIYEDAGERIIGDIDFLVPEKDYLAAAELFKNEGYTLCHPIDAPVEQAKHYPRLWKEDVTADLEIHRLVVPQRYTKHFSAELVQGSKKAVTSYPGCYVLSDDHKVILNFIHSQLANAGHALGVVSLRDVYDLYRFSKKVDLQQVSKVAPFRRQCISWLKISEMLLDLPDSFYPGETIRSRLYRFKHDLVTTSSLVYKGNRFKWVLSEGKQFVARWITESFSNSTLRRENLNKIFSPAWHWRNLKIGLLLIKNGKS